MANKKQLTSQQQTDLLKTLQNRFNKNSGLHKNITWDKILVRLENQPQKLWSLFQMEETGGEPDITGIDSHSGELIFTDCAAESPKGRRSLCYDREALESRKQHKPKGSAMEMAADMGAELLSEEQYRELQQRGAFDTKTSSWVKTPGEIRELGGALFCDRRYNTVFTYHNGAESYYAARGFRTRLQV